MLDRYRVIILPRASSDITRAFDYIEKDSPQNATLVVQRLFDAINSLAFLPQRYKVFRASKKPERVVRSTLCCPSFLYYRVIEQEKVVIVLTIRHGAQRQPRDFD